MAFPRVILFSIFLASTLCSLSEGYNFLVGGKNGWSTHPSENYNDWASRLRFLVNDTLTFKYNKETDSVVVVTKHHYEKCNAAKPIQKMDDGDSIFKFEHSGPFYFITGNKTNCNQGQKLTIVVLAVRSYPPPPSVPAPTPAPESIVPVPSPESIVPVPSPETEVPSPSPSSEGPTVSPAPVIPGPEVSPAPVIPGPAVSPAPVVPGPAVSPSPSPLSPDNTPADSNLTPAPAPAKSFAPASSPAKLVTAVLTMAALIAFA